MAGLAKLEGKVAVVTGGAGGMGRGIAEELLARGAKVVIGDIERDTVAATASAIGAVGVVTDVSKIESVRALADETLRRFGRVDIVCNNAGVGPFAKIEDMTLDDWKFMIDVNLWGVIHGINVFLPHLIGNKNGGHMVNTASQGGLVAFPRVGGYCTTKFAVVGMSESLAAELAQDHPKVGVSILCPGPVNTNINRSSRNRPATLAAIGARDVEMSDTTKDFKGAVNWLEPRQVGEIVADSIEDGRLYAITHPEMFGPIRARHDAIAAAHAPGG
ncbi:MAG: SDR family NAD(P)-dependent oxidoreductase [Rhodospirillaceae bacterium]|nr:MAG: SDR family NAD(P)-dependent oxidoreductase [Rhodospirillaceae bacterium]